MFWIIEISYLGNQKLLHLNLENELEGKFRLLKTLNLRRNCVARHRRWSCCFHGFSSQGTRAFPSKPRPDPWSTSFAHSGTQGDRCSALQNCKTKKRKKDTALRSTVDTFFFIILFLFKADITVRKYKRLSFTNPYVQFPFCSIREFPSLPPLHTLCAGRNDKTISSGPWFLKITRWIKWKHFFGMSEGN